MPAVTTPQIALLLIATALFAVGVALSVLRIWWDATPRLETGIAAAPPLTRSTIENDSRWRIASKSCFYGGVVLALCVLLWHASSRGSWQPLDDNFDSFLWLSILLALLVLYIQRRHPLRGLDWFVMPMVMLLLVAAAVFGRTEPHEYVDNTWSLVHRITAYGGAGAFAVGCAGGTMFLIVSHRLRNKSLRPGSARAPIFGSLERLEHLMLTSVTVGFALLTIGAITGLVKILETGPKPAGVHWFFNPKLLLSAGAWVIYAVVLHSPLNPAFRGRRAALLSVVGFVLMIGTLVAVQFMPK